MTTTSSMYKEVANTYIDWYARSAKAWEKRIEETTRPSALVSWAGQCEYCGCLIAHEDRFCVRCGAPPPAGILGVLANPVAFKTKAAMEDYSGKHYAMFQAIDEMGHMTWVPRAGDLGLINWRI